MGDHFIRLSSYRTYLYDGKGYAEYKCSAKGEVFVALLLGMEPKIIKQQSDFLDADALIVKMAEHIKAAKAGGGE